MCKYHRFTAIAWSFTFLLLLAGIGTTSAATSIPASIGTQLWPGALPIYTAIAAGITDKNGVTIDKIIVSSGGNRRAALLAGEIQFAEFAFSNVAVAASKGAPIKYVMATDDYEAFSFIVRSGLKDQVKSIEDLKGHIVGFTTPGAGAWAWARIFLLKSGLDPDTDVGMVGGMSKPSIVLTSLKAGKIDAHPSWEPITTMALQSGIAFPLVSIWKPTDQDKWVGKTGLGSGLSTTTTVIEEQPELVRRMVASVKGGIDYINANDAETIAGLITNHPKTGEHWGGIDREILVDMINKSKASFQATDGRISKSGVANELKTMKTGGILKKDIPFDVLVDGSFAGVKP